MPEVAKIMQIKTEMGKLIYIYFYSTNIFWIRLYKADLIKKMINWLVILTQYNICCNLVINDFFFFKTLFPCWIQKLFQSTNIVFISKGKQYFIHCSSYDPFNHEKRPRVMAVTVGAIQRLGIVLDWQLSQPLTTQGGNCVTFSIHQSQRSSLCQV